MLRKAWVLSSLSFIFLYPSLPRIPAILRFITPSRLRICPPGEKIEVWIPAAHSDAYQEVKIVSAKGDLPLKKTRESKFGNEIYYAETVPRSPSCTSKSNMT